MGYWDYFWGTLRDYCGDAFPSSLLRTRALLRVPGDPLKGTLHDPTYGSLRRGLIERVYIPRVPERVI